MGLLQLGLWLYYCLHDFYGGARLLVLPVHAGLKFGMAHPQIAQMLTSPAGYFSTSSRGDLLYHPVSLCDYFLFFTIGDLTILDALFLAGLGYFLYCTLRRLPAGPEFTLAASRVVEFSGLALISMFVLKMIFNVFVIEVFKSKTQGLFQLAILSSSTLYVVAGLLLTLCANLLRRGQQLQQEADLRSGL
ncbi:hypothetical protein A8B98_18295 [Hymenobacter sp. UV11]|nr:hypothetical protein A8B98_18295 [Hymenobacter sp. UV11]